MFNYNGLLEHFNEELNKEINKLASRQPKNLYEPVIYTLNMGGKRIRPVLLLNAHSLYNEKLTTAMPVALAIELFHNFTLLHDDIMDNADLRRNRNTVHIEYSNNSAILSGDAMSILAYEYLNKCQSENYREIFDLFTNTALQVCEGQQFDMDFEKRNDVTVDEYLNMIGLKTAVLLAASLKLGAILANAPIADRELLYRFGYNLGMAFQLQDDLLDSFGETADFGKKIGGDIVANKKTFLMLTALELAKDDTLAHLNLLIQTEPSSIEDKIEKVLSYYKALNIEKLTQQKIEFYYDSALNCLENLSLETSNKNTLRVVSDWLMARKH
jgi:geranylgeranyl diphosphate synthase type II